VRADTPDAARAQLASRRLYVVRIEPRSAGAAPPLLSRGLLARRRLGVRQLTLFTRQLATLVTVAPLEEALRTLSRQAERDEVRRILGSVHEGVVEGRRLADAMGREPKCFPPLYRAMVAAGEGSGTLPHILERLAALLERQTQVRGKVL
jgi:general secretion pathway protein F